MNEPDMENSNEKNRFNAAECDSIDILNVKNGCSELSEKKAMHEREGFILSDFRADVSELPSVMEILETKMEMAGVSMKAFHQISVAAEEIFVNIAKYAYTDDSGKMLLGLKFTENTAEIRFADCGTPFNPLKVKVPDTDISAEERKIGGLGIHLVRKMMDDVLYRYEDGQNIFTMIKHF